jgi:L-threonylcarbamoyladenylate synthase
MQDVVNVGGAVGAAEIARAAALLESGGLVAFPTETVYGLGADAENPAAVARIYQAKGRPHDHPVIVHLAPGADLGYWSDAISLQARQLIEAFWPGPLTLILKRAARIPAAVSGGQDTVGLRCPSHPVAIALLNAFKGGYGGIAAPSANKFGHVSPTTARHVRDEFGPDDGIGAILDGGQSGVGIESTILDLSRLATHGPVLLRPGHLGAAEIAEVIGAMPVAADVSAPRTSGSLASHYAPQTPVVLQQGADLAATLALLQERGRRVALIHHSGVADALAGSSVRLPAEPAAYAHGLYVALRAMDHAAIGLSLDLILVEAPPANDAWQGVNDRLRRAAHGSSGMLAGLLA